MTTDLPPLGRLYSALSVLILAWSAGGVLAWHGLSALQQATAGQRQATAAYDAAVHRVDEARRLERQLEQERRIWQDLRQAGYTAGENLPAWSTLLDEARNELGLPEFAANFGAARRSADTATPGWIARPLYLRVRLRHEADLSRLLRHLRRHARALIAIRSCRIEATDDEPEISGLRTECDLEWLTIEPEPQTP